MLALLELISDYTSNHASNHKAPYVVDLNLTVDDIAVRLQALDAAHSWRIWRTRTMRKAWNIWEPPQKEVETGRQEEVQHNGTRNPKEERDNQHSAPVASTCSPTMYKPLQDGEEIVSDDPPLILAPGCKGDRWRKSESKYQLWLLSALPTPGCTQCRMKRENDSYARTGKAKCPPQQRRRRADRWKIMHGIQGVFLKVLRRRRKKRLIASNVICFLWSWKWRIRDWGGSRYLKQGMLATQS